MNRWSPPQVTNTKRNIGPRPEKDWTEEEDEVSLGNSCALNAIFNGVDKNVFRLINTCVSTKKA